MPGPRADRLAIVALSSLAALATLGNDGCSDDPHGDEATAGPGAGAGAGSGTGASGSAGAGAGSGVGAGTGAGTSSGGGSTSSMGTVTTGAGGADACPGASFGAKPSVPYPSLAEAFDGKARFVVDPSFSPPKELVQHAETTTARFGGKYLMYYRSFDGTSKLGVSLALSEDGDAWKAHAGGARVLSAGAPGSFDAGGLYAPSVTMAGGKLYMAYEAVPADVNQGKQEIAVARSSDGVTWEKLGIAVKAGAGWESANVGTPSLHVFEGTFYVFYHGFNGADAPGSLARGFASGLSPTSLVKHGPPVLTAGPVGSWNDAGPGRGDIVQEGSEYFMVIEGLKNSPLCKPETDTGWTLARSKDLVSWAMAKGTPLVTDADAGGCGEDMPAWQVVGDRKMVVATKPDAMGVRRHKLVPTDRAGIASLPGGCGYWVASASGAVFAFGAAPDLGRPPALGSEIVGIAASPSGEGYWVAGAGGAVRAMGDAKNHGSMEGKPLAAPVVGIAASPSGGYYLAAKDGGVFAFGAPFFGSAGAEALAAPVVGIAASPDGKGYWLASADGGVYTFGEGLGFFGSMGGKPLKAPIVAIASSPSGGGYLLAAADGGVFAFGDAEFSGALADVPLVQPIAGLALAPSGEGYWMVGKDGGVFSFDLPYFGNAAR